MENGQSPKRAATLCMCEPTQHPASHRETADRGSNGLDDSGSVKARYGRPRRDLLAGVDHDAVAGADGNSFDADYDFITLDFGGIDGSSDECVIPRPSNKVPGCLQRHLSRC